jgi:HEAT repeat protein
MKDVVAQLSPEEPNYAKAQRLGPEALPYLLELVQGGDMALATKAAYLASLIEGEQRVEVLGAAAASEEPVLRIAAAAGIRNLSEPEALQMVAIMREDQDIGVRQQVVVSAANFVSPNVVSALQGLAEVEPEQFVRDLIQNTVTSLEERIK